MLAPVSAPDSALRDDGVHFAVGGVLFADAIVSRDARAVVMVASSYARGRDRGNAGC